MSNIKKEFLAPCPFCGGEAELIDGQHKNWINCSNLECELDCSTRWYTTKNEAIKAWNTRSEPNWPEKNIGIDAECEEGQIWNQAIDACIKAYKEANGKAKRPEGRGE